jgi:hypothetical protein
MDESSSSPALDPKRVSQFRGTLAIRNHDSTILVSIESSIEKPTTFLEKNNDKDAKIEPPPAVSRHKSDPLPTGDLFPIQILST